MPVVANTVPPGVNVELTGARVETASSAETAPVCAASPGGHVSDDPCMKNATARHALSGERNDFFETRPTPD
jgi:hypothetical protein